MKIVFLGSADFGIPSLQRLMEFHTIAAIVSTPAKPQGRGLHYTDSPVTLFAKKHDLKPIITPEDLKSEEFCRLMASFNADLFVVVAFRILPKAIFALPPLGTLNIHASLLPKFRGPAPIQRAIEAGEKETGVSIFRLDEGIDTGEILLQKKTLIGSDETTPELYQRLSLSGAQALMETIDTLEKGRIEPVKQNDTGASKAPKLKKEEALIDWNLSSEKIYNKIRAFKPFPGTYTLFENKRLGILWAEKLAETTALKPGVIVRVTQNYFDVQCGSGILRILKVKPEGRKEMDTRDFLSGTEVKEKSILH
ncbi:MAG TPA: methionyl-tRNA formyltransferase [Chitinispirillaceae bacterium]|nr:methionyl-tRNA formyltransferase [Chitinispirillaceae bacterium]